MKNTKAVKRTVVKEADQREAVAWCEIVIRQFMKITLEPGG